MSHPTRNGLAPRDLLPLARHAGSRPAPLTEAGLTQCPEMPMSIALEATDESPDDLPSRFRKGARGWYECRYRPNFLGAGWAPLLPGAACRCDLAALPAGLDLVVYPNSSLK